MNWVEALNTISCLFLLYFLLVAAHFANKWSHRLAVAPITIMVVLQTFDPIVSFIPNLAWPAVAFNATLVITITLLRKELLTMVKGL